MRCHGVKESHGSEAASRGPAGVWEGARLPDAAVRRQESEAALKVMQINSDGVFLRSSGM